MITWIRHIHWKSVFIIGLLYTVISVIVRQIEAMLTIHFYKDPRYYGVWSRIMMPSDGPPPAEFILVSLIFSFITGMSITIIYYYLTDMLPKQEMKRIFLFADLLIATSFIFFTLPVYLLFNIPPMLLVSWFVSGFLILTVTSFAIVKIVGRK